MIVIKPKKGLGINLKELWAYRELLYFLSWRDVKVRYKQTFIGILWAVFQPLLTMVVFTFFFNKVVGVSSGNIPYPIFSFSGLLFWNYFSSSLQDVSNSLITNQSIITKVFFPRIFIPLSSAVVPMVDFLFALVIYLGLLLFFHIQITIGILVIIPLLFMALISAIGLGSFLAILNVKYRDIRYALPFFIQLLLFVTPVIYPVTQIPKKFQLFMYVNPLTGIIEVTRTILLHQTSTSLSGIVVSAFSSVILLLLGLVFFTHYEREVADSL